MWGKGWVLDKATNEKEPYLFICVYVCKFVQLFWRSLPIYFFPSHVAMCHLAVNTKYEAGVFRQKGTP